MLFIKSAWQGEERLWKVFWLYGLPVVFIGFFGSLCVEIGAAMGVGVVGRPSESTWCFWYDIWEIVSLCYWVWLCTSLWRCAFNVEKRFLGYGARALAVFVVILVCNNYFYANSFSLFHGHG